MIAYLQLCSRNRKKNEAGSHALPSCLWTLSSQWLWLLPKLRNVLKDWGFDIGRGIQKIYFRIWKQFQEESENPFEQKQYHQRKYISLPRWQFEGEELTGQCKVKFHPFSFLSLPSLFFESVTLQSSKYLIEYHMKELDQELQNQFPSKFRQEV